MTTNSFQKIDTPKPRIWLGIIVGWLVQLGLKSFLPILVLTAIRFLSLETENPGLWLENSNDSSHPIWYVLQLTVFVASCSAGALAATLSRGKYTGLVIGLIIMSLLATCFEQFPLLLSAAPLPTVVLLIWAGGPCLGVAVGVFIVQFFHKKCKRH